MIIKKFYLGDFDEAYIEKKLIDDFNIISSDDNNKGKTIAMQSIMYTFGNSPLFPSTFRYEKYFFVVDFEFDKKEYSLCRKNNSFIIRDNEKKLTVFDNLEEFEKYFSKKFFKLPTIIKNGREKMVDFELLCQLFFLGQDKKDTSNIANAGRYNKNDFYNMLYSMKKINTVAVSDVDVTEIKENIKMLKAKKAVLQKKAVALNEIESTSNSICASKISKEFSNSVSCLNTLRDELVELKNRRSKILNRKLNNQITLKEMNSVNKIMPMNSVKVAGEFRVAEYHTAGKDFAFDITNPELRKHIIKSIEEKMKYFDKALQDLNVEIEDKGSQIREALKNDELSIENLILYKKDIFDTQKIDNEILELDNEIAKLNDTVKNNKDTYVVNKDKQKKLIDEILKAMKEFYHEVEPEGNLDFDDIFSKKDRVFSGSEEAEFYLSKLYAMLKVFKHPFPIVIDSFREGELSSIKEETTINMFRRFPNQKIFTATLKEYELGRYAKMKGINAVSYTFHTPSQILLKRRADEFKEKLAQFNIVQN